MPDMSTQLAQEQRMRDRGADRARRTQSRQETAETPAGIQLAKKAVEPLTNAIRAFLAPSKGRRAPAHRRQATRWGRPRAGGLHHRPLPRSASPPAHDPPQRRYVASPESWRPS